MSIKIYFDLDGVLADFEQAETAVSQGVDFNRSSGLLSDEQKRAEAEFWRKIEGTDFFKNIPPMAGADRLLKAARKISGENMFVLSRAPKPEKFAAGETEQARVAEQKREWVLARFGAYFTRSRIFIALDGAKEKMIAHPQKWDILIDDRPETVDGWTAAGGAGVVFSSPKDAEGRLKKLAAAHKREYYDCRRVAVLELLVRACNGM